ncbi:GNAT family N-acetyltransferase [Salidesulfovibrio brasiliensis]|uniref:GNAT family N-acetyltransferase n=1 Tax=Salidesulfovibrio brasiliensis TaxID=221711 RepID=UPI0006D222D3|nr:GNAT family N-acetyltransferase [Salidesulfovibrio brasiliensis]
MSKDILIRPASSDDVPHIERVLKESFEASYADFMPPEFIEKWESKDLAGRLARRAWPEFSVAERNGRVCGVVQVQDAHLAELWVAPECIQQGIGSKLLAYAEWLAYARGFDTASLFVYDINVTARQFYRKHGWAVVNAFPSKDVPGSTVLEKHKRLGS